MKFRFAALLGAGILLSGCSDFSFDDILGFPAASPAELAASHPAPAPIASAPAPSAFCRSVAQQDVTQNTFDAATQARMAQKDYVQCVALFGGN